MKVFSSRFYKWFVVAAGLALLLACAGKIPHMLVADYGKRGIRLVAVMPVVNKSQDDKAARMLREKTLDALFQKGYPKIPFQVIDEKIQPSDVADLNKARDLLGVDAVLQITLEQCFRSVTLTYVRTYMEASFVLRNVKTGEVLWEVKYHTGERNIDITKKRAELKSVQSYEPMIQEVVDRAVETLPDGPDL